MAIAGNPVTVMGPLAERLASIPQTVRNKTAGDGTEPTPSQPTQTPDDMAPGMPAPQPTLETADPTTVFRTTEQLVRSQDRLARNRWAIDTFHRWLDSNVPFGYLEKVPNQSIWIAKRPSSVAAERRDAIPNKASDLCTKVCDALLADPPKPNPQIHDDDESVAMAAELATEFLRQNAGESGIKEVDLFRFGLRSALTNSTTFVHYEVDEDGGGYQPLQVLAHPEAQDPANPLVAMVPGPPDPFTGQPVLIEQPAVDPILRYVSPPAPDAPSGRFVKQASEADRVWLPKITANPLRRECVRIFPATAAIEDADAAIVLGWCTLAEGRQKWQSVRDMTPEQLTQLASWRHAMSDMIVPIAFKGGTADGMTGPALTDVGSFSPMLQRRMFYYRLYVKSSTEYPKGLQIDISGANGGTLLDRRTLDYTVTLPKGGQDTRCRDIPLAQITPQQDVLDGDPTGWPFENRFAGSAEATATLYAGFLDRIDKMNHPHVFISGTTAVDEDDWADRSMPIILNPGDQAPTYEQFAALPPMLQVIQDLDTKQDTASGLTATAQGLDSENAQSGVAKQLTVRQAQISLAGIQQNLHAAFTRGWRIMCQLAQAEYKTPQLLRYTGEDGSAQVRWWTGDDFAGIDDIGIEPGTGTMMTAEAKANYVAFMQSQFWMTPEEAKEIGVAGIARDLGLPPNPVDQAIERAVTTWLQGPPDGWQAPQPMQLPGVDPMTGQPVLQQVMGPPSWTPFTPRPNDDEPMVAKRWMQRLSKLVMSSEYESKPPEYRALVDQRYMAARQAVAAASAPPPVPGQAPAQLPSDPTAPQTTPQPAMSIAA